MSRLIILAGLAAISFNVTATASKLSHITSITYDAGNNHYFVTLKKSQDLNSCGRDDIFIMDNKLLKKNKRQRKEQLWSIIRAAKQHGDQIQLISDACQTSKGKSCSATTVTDCYNAFNGVKQY